MKAIETKYLPATDRRGTRIKAYAEGGNSITVGRYNDRITQLDGEALCKEVAIMLCEKMNWPTELLGGGKANGDYVFVFKNQ